MTICRGTVGLAAAAAMVVMGACKGDTPESIGTALTMVSPPVTVGPHILESTISPENDGFGFARGTDIRIVRGRLAVLENRSSRIVLFNEAFRATSTIGREGAGPGELRGVLHMDASDDRIAVSEINNRRISVFKADGSFERSFPVPSGNNDFAVAPSGIFYVVSGDLSQYLVAVDETSGATPFGERPIELYPPEDFVGRYRGLGQERVAVTSDGRVHVVDYHLGAFVQFAPSGERLGIARLPSEIRQLLRERAALVASDFGGTGEGWVYTKGDLTVTDDDLLLLTLPMRDRVFALLVNPATNEAREIRSDPSVGQPYRPPVAILRGDRMYLLQGDEVTVHDVLPPDR